MNSLHIPKGEFHADIIASILISAIPQSISASESDAKAAVIMWTAFECGTYAELSSDPERQAALLERGLIAGKQFFAAVEAGSITAEEQPKHVPFMVTMLANGPSVDFVLGRIFESAMNSAYEDVVKEDMAGLPLPMSEWTTNDELQKSRAALLYQRGNCYLL